MAVRSGTAAAEASPCGWCGAWVAPVRVHARWRRSASGRASRRNLARLGVPGARVAVRRDGELDLDSPAARWLPELPHEDAITVRMLLGHRSGLREYFGDPGVRHKLNDPRASRSRGELLDAVGRLGSEAEPDQRFAYRNTNYLAVGEILERLTGESIADLVEERISRPLGLTTLSFAGAEFGVGRIAGPHKRRRRRPVDLLSRTDGHLPSHTFGEVWTDGGLAASAEDLATLTEALLRGGLLRPETVEEMTRRSASPGSAVGGLLGVLQRVYLGPARRSYGLGVAVEQREDTTVLGHDGMYYGWSAMTTYDARTHVTVAVVTNLAAIPVPAQRLQRAVRSALAAG